MNTKEFRAHTLLVRFEKKRFGVNHPALIKLFRDATAYHKAVTVPYGVDGFALMRASMYSDYRAVMEAFSLMLRYMGDELLAYGNGASVCLLHSFQSLPNMSGLFFNSIELLMENEDHIALAMKHAKAYVVGRLYDRLATVHSVLDDPDRIFRDSLINSLVEFLNGVDVVNLTDCDGVTKTAREAKDIFDDIDINELRTDKGLRIDVALDVATVMGCVGLLMEEVS